MTGAAAEPMASADADDLPIVILDDEVAAPLADMVPPALLNRLLVYAQGRLAAGVGADRFQACALAAPSFIDLYRPGFIPGDYRAVLAPAEAAILAHIDLADCCVVPAFDRQGTVVDLACWRLGEVISFIGSLQTMPAGMLAPRMVEVAEELVLVDDLGELCRHLAAGGRHVQLLRPDVPLDAQVQELVAREVRAVRLATKAAGLMEVCTAAGITVHQDRPSAAWTLVTFDQDHHRAVFQAGDLVVASDTPWRGSSKLRVDARRGDGRCQGDLFDVAVPRQVQAFATLAARKLQVDVALLMTLLGTGFLERLQALEAGEGQAAAPSPAPSSNDIDACLMGNDLTARFVHDTETLGWIGDAQAKTLALLTLAGLNLEQPPWLLLRGPSAITLSVVGMLADLLPPERRLHLSRAAESSLPNQGQDGLRHRLLVIDDLAALRATTLTTLRVLQARGGIALPVAVRNADTGRMVSRLAEARGPVGMIAAASEATDGDDLGVTVQLDDTPAQTAHAMAAARQLCQAGVDEQARNRARSRWQGVLATLPRIAVRVPGADRVVFPARHPRHRVEQDWFFALVEASALLHNRQRPQVDGHLVATDADIQLVIQATRGLLGRVDDGLSDRARQLVDLIANRPGRTITIPQLAEVCPHWTRDMARGALDELTRAKVVDSPATGRGRKARAYILAMNPDQNGIRLMPAAEQELGTTPFAFPNISRVASCG